MRSIFPFFILVLCPFWLLAQSRSKITYSASLNPSATFPLNLSSSREIVSGNPYQTHQQYADSVRTFETFKLSIGATVWVEYLLGRKWSVQAGLGYNETGFTRDQTNIMFRDKLFPGVGDGMLVENSGSAKSIKYSFRYQYLTLPVLFNCYAKRSGNYKWTYYFTAGAGLNLLLNHEVKATLKGFVMDGESTFHIDSTGYEGRKFSVNLYVGGKFEYKLDKNITLYAQPMLTAYPFSVSKTPIGVYPIGLTVNCGVIYAFGKKDEN